MVACVHACMLHGPWLSLDLDAPSSLELPRTRKPCSTCDTLAHQTASCSVTVPVATELQACYGDKKLLKFAGRRARPRAPFHAHFKQVRSKTTHHKYLNKRMLACPLRSAGSGNPLFELALPAQIPCCKVPNLDLHQPFRSCPGPF